MCIFFFSINMLYEYPEIKCSTIIFIIMDEKRKSFDSEIDELGILRYPKLIKTLASDGFIKLNY